MIQIDHEHDRLPAQSAVSGRDRFSWSVDGEAGQARDLPVPD